MIELKNKRSWIRFGLPLFVPNILQHLMHLLNEDYRGAENTSSLFLANSKLNLHKYSYLHWYKKGVQPTSLTPGMSCTGLWSRCLQVTWGTGSPLALQVKTTPDLLLKVTTPPESSFSVCPSVRMGPEGRSCWIFRSDVARGAMLCCKCGLKWGEEEMWWGGFER